jgi:hypothetical protein
MSESLPKKKRPDVRRLFQERMERDGRGDEWRETVRSLMASTGKSFGQVRWEAMKKMGYTDPKLEHQYHADYEKSQRTAAIIADQSEFDIAVASLPATAQGSSEMAWILSHPVMLRRAREDDDRTVILLNSHDLDGAPSRKAVTLLQWYLRSPSEMLKQVMSEMKKETTGGEAGQKGAQKDEDLDEVRRLLEEVKA